MKKILYKFLLIVLLSVSLIACKKTPDNNGVLPPTDGEDISLVDERKAEDYDIFEDELYISQDEVALYIFFFSKLPKNYVKKNDIVGHISKYWNQTNLLSIGGDYFYNRERLLPELKNRVYFEADINYYGQSSRNAERIVFSDDGLIFYTNDHYANFSEFDTEEFSWVC